MGKTFLKNPKILYTLITCFVYVFVLTEVNALAVQYNERSKNHNVAPERNYERETITFPNEKKTIVKKDILATEKKTEKTSVITNGIVPMIVMGVIVLGIFLWICLAIVKKLLPGGKKLFASPGLEILGKTHFDPQKYLALVRVGTRVLIVGVSPNGFDQISEITNPEEITEVMSSAKPKTSTGQNLFYKMFQKQIENIGISGKNNTSSTSKTKNNKNIADETKENAPEKTDITERQQRIKKIRDLEA